MTVEEKLNFFKNELNLIKNENVRKFVEIILSNTGDWFYKDPASTSGKYHPKFSLGEGGLVRHTRAVVYFILEFQKTMLFLDKKYNDYLIAAAIMHDIRKHTAEGKFVENHAREAHNLVLETQKENPELISEKESQFIANMISTHMGIWGKKQCERAPQKSWEILLHLADYTASRREIDLNIFNNE